MQKDWKVAADLTIAECSQFFGRRADNHPVPLCDRPAEQLVANGAAYQIHLHRQILTEFR